MQETGETRQQNCARSQIIRTDKRRPCMGATHFTKWNLTRKPYRFVGRLHPSATTPLSDSDLCRRTRNLVKKWCVLRATTKPTSKCCSQNWLPTLFSAVWNRWIYKSWSQKEKQRNRKVSKSRSRNSTMDSMGRKTMQSRLRGRANERSNWKTLIWKRQNLHSKTQKWSFCHS